MCRSINVGGAVWFSSESGILQQSMMMAGEPSDPVSNGLVPDSLTPFTPQGTTHLCTTSCPPGSILERPSRAIPHHPSSENHQQFTHLGILLYCGHGSTWPSGTRRAECLVRMAIPFNIKCPFKIVFCQDSAYIACRPHGPLSVGRKVLCCIVLEGRIRQDECE